MKYWRFILYVYCSHIIHACFSITVYMCGIVYVGIAFSLDPDLVTCKVGIRLNRCANVSTTTAFLGKVLTNHRRMSDEGDSFLPLIYCFVGKLRYICWWIVSESPGGTWCDNHRYWCCRVSKIPSIVVDVNDCTESRNICTWNLIIFNNSIIDDSFCYGVVHFNWGWRLWVIHLIDHVVDLYHFLCIDGSVSHLDFVCWWHDRTNDSDDGVDGYIVFVEKIIRCFIW